MNRMECLGKIMKYGWIPSLLILFLLSFVLLNNETTRIENDVLDDYRENYISRKFLNDF